MGKYVIAISGASGAAYGVQLLKELLIRDSEIHLIVSDPALLVIEHELGWDLSASVENTFKQYLPAGDIHFYDNGDIAASLASGSYITDAMVIIPCSMASVSGIAAGNARNLIERTADVMLKEKRRLILVPRETPLNSIHLRNMLSLSDLGVHIIPAMPAFYHRPETVEDMINFIIGKVMDSLNISHDLFKRYEK